MILTFPRATVWLPIALGLLLLTTGCTTGNPFGHAEPAETKPIKTAPAPATPPPRVLLKSGVAAYNSGDFPVAIKRLAAASEPARNDQTTQLEAIKYLAFSYCVTSQIAQCQLQFERALRIDPAFDLAPGEKGHPLWGPVFDRAKNSR